MTKEESLEDISAKRIRKTIIRDAPAHTPKNLPESGEELLATPECELRRNREIAYGRPTTCSQMSIGPSHKECNKYSLRTPWHEYVRRDYYWAKGDRLS